MHLTPASPLNPAALVALLGVPYDPNSSYLRGAAEAPLRIREALFSEAGNPLAGLWEHWKDANGQTVESCTIVTVDANALIAELHDRMPLIVAPGDYDAWLRAESKELPHAVAAETMRYHPVSTLVSNARNDVAACLDRIDEA